MTKKRKARQARAKPRDRSPEVPKGGGRGLPLNVHPGELLREEFMKPLGVTPEMLAKAIPRSADFPAADYAAQIRELILADEESYVSISLALALDRYFGLSPGYFWRAQADYEIREELHQSRKWLGKIKPLRSGWSKAQKSGDDRVLAAGLKLFTTEEVLRDWMSKSAIWANGRTPAELVANGKADDVVGALQGLAYGNIL